MDAERGKRQAQIFKALAHPSRLAMLEALGGGERCVCDLQKLVGSDMSTVSKHLSVLKAAGLVEDRKEGLWVHYRLRVLCVLEFMECINVVLDTGACPTTLNRNHAPGQTGGGCGAESVESLSNASQGEP
jgi:ArsR family transcriptional regulator